MYEQRHGEHGKHPHMSSRTRINAQGASCEGLLPRLHEAVSPILSCSEDVEGVIQEAMLMAWRKCPAALWREDAVKQLRRWLFVTARRLAFNWSRRLKRHRMQSLDALPGEPRDRRDEESANQEYGERRRALLDAWIEELLDKDPVSYRLLYGRFFEVRQIKELAAAEGLSENAASHRISRTIQLFRERASWLRDEETESW
ncbi:MAG TPA: sigma-70 family RNA polymerase sigma factor [Gemmataceae bacterium]|jgi:RNA polymerase sigma factor (sigma-70 family)